MKQFFKDMLEELSWLAILSVVCVILLNVLMVIGVATWSLAVSLDLLTCPRVAGSACGTRPTLERAESGESHLLALLDLLLNFIDEAVHNAAYCLLRFAGLVRDGINQLALVQNLPPP